MDRLSFERFTEILGATVTAGSATDVPVEHVATHSSRIRSGAAFFALRGGRTDGHRFVEAAARNGAVAAVVDAGRMDEVAGSGLPVVGVDDPLRALQRLAGWWRRQLDATVVAVAGSVGKTVTKDCLVHLLAAAGDVYGTSGSYNSQLGVPLAVLDCPRTARVAVLEVAVSDPGEMASLAGVVAPDVVVLTNVGTRWRRRFRDRAHQIEELLVIAHGRPVLLGQADPDLVEAARAVASAVYAHGRSADLPRFDRTRRDPATADVKAAFPDGTRATIGVRTPSDDILDDVELAVSAAWLLGAGAEAVATALHDYTPTSTRMEIWRSPTGVTLVRDVATPDPIAVRSAVRTARRLTSEGCRTVLVLPQPEATWDEAALSDLAHVLAGEQVDEILGLAGGCPAAAGLDGLVPVRRFPSAGELRAHLVDKLAVGDVCLVQSPPGRRIGDLASSLVEAMAPTRLYIDLSAMQENVTTFRRLVGPGVQIMAMVKALAYGTDALAASLGLHESGIDWLGVSGADEGVALRRAGVNLPVVVMLGTPDEVAKMARHRLTPLVYSESMLAAVTRLAAEEGRPVGVHVEVDTGMHRSGLDWATAASRLADVVHAGHLRVEGLMTHLACADDPAKDHLTALQLARFEPLVAAARDLGLTPIVHAAATAGTIRFPNARWDLVRLGLGLWGLHPSPATARELALDPVLSLVSRLVQVIDVPAGEGVGYGATYLAPAAGGRVGVVPAGYHDCVPRSFSNVGYVVVDGVRCPIVGTVSMDSMTIDLSGCPSAVVGSDVLIYGRAGAHEVPLEEVSAAIGTIPYEVMARVGPRVQRVFTRH